MLVREVFDLVRGLYTAATGALVAEANVDTIANNLSNASTAGFKRTLMQIQSAAKTDLYRNQTDPGQLPNAYVPGVAAHQAIGQLGSGSYVYDTPTEFDQGALQTSPDGSLWALSSKPAGANSPGPWLPARSPSTWPAGSMPAV